MGIPLTESFEQKFNRVLKKINTSQSHLRETSFEVLSLIVDVLGADKAEITVFNEDFNIRTMPFNEEKAVKFRLRHGYSEEQWKPLEEMGILREGARFALEKKESRMVSDTRSEQERLKALSEFLEIGSWMNHVLCKDGTVLAYVHLGKREHGYYTGEHLERLGCLSELLATAINVSMGFERKYNRVLKRINTAHCDLKKTSLDILDFMMEIFDADMGEISVYNEEFDIAAMELTEEAAVRFRLKRGYREEQWKRLEDSGVLMESTRFSLEKKESRVVPDTRKEEPAARALSEYLENGSWMNYLLVNEDRVLANIHLAKKEHGYYRQDDLERLGYLSTLFATAINLSSLWERERKILVNFIESLNRALELRDEYTAGHVERVRLYSTGLARAMGLPEDEIEDVSMAAVLHDIGKIGISDKILKKKRGLSWDEQELIRRHVPLTDEIIKNLHHMDRARLYARYHHESFDGKGYVMGLKGDEIPVGSKILSIADAFDAMTSDRPYRKAFFVEEALRILGDPEIHQWDDRLVRLFDDYVHSREFFDLAVKEGLIKFDEEGRYYRRKASTLRFRSLSKFFVSLQAPSY
ncbi:MAG: HD-GYP domain-containing protein [Candidatus Eremiobacteraeota bacterium]|nr:HD-GYP domain-containing protein [Candidatus Eremiobacteraeota bacterium]